MTGKQIQHLPFYQHSNAFDEKELATVRYADLVSRGASATRRETLEALGKFFTEDEIVQLTLVICMANFTNRFNDALQVKPDLGED